MDKSTDKHALTLGRSEVHFGTQYVLLTSTTTINLFVCMKQQIKRDSRLSKIMDQYNKTAPRTATVQIIAGHFKNIILQ